MLSSSIQKFKGKKFPDLYRAALNRLVKTHDRLLASLNYPGYEIQSLRANLLRKQCSQKSRVGSVGRSVTDKVLLELESFVRKFPNHPEPYLHLAMFQLFCNLPESFDTSNTYGKVRKQWLADSGLDALDLEFIPTSAVVGSLGNHAALRSLIKAQLLGLRPDKQLVLPLSFLPVRNASLFEYFRPFLSVIVDENMCRRLEKLAQVLTLPLGFCLPLDEVTPHLFLADSLTRRKWQEAGKEPLLGLTDEHVAYGTRVLREMGVPKDAWYVALHARERGYRGETGSNDDYRNTNPETYIAAIKEITASGGWVLRMGGAEMTPLPTMPNLVDYAHSPFRSDQMDVFLLASSRFTIGTSSGPYTISTFFGVPVLMTNLLPFLAVYVLGAQDMFLPRLCRKGKEGEMLSFRELLTPPISTLTHSRSYKLHGLDWIENTSDELALATREMIRRTENGALDRDNRESQVLHERFQQLCDTTLHLHGSVQTRLSAHMATDFLRSHAGLLE